MFSFFTRTNTEATTRATTTRTRLGVEVLEARDVPAAYTWAGTNGVWAEGENWLLNNQKAAAPPSEVDTIIFAAGSNASITIPSETKVAGLQIEATYGGTLTLAGSFEVTGTASQKSGTISEGVFTFSGTEYLWTGGVRVGTGAESNTEVFTVIGTNSNLRLPSTTTVGIEGATVQVQGTATYDNDQQGATAMDKGLVSLGKTGRFVVDGVNEARVVKEGDGELIFEDDKKFGESQVIIDGTVSMWGGKVSVNADFHLKSGSAVNVGLTQTETCLFFVGGASVSSGLYHIGKMSEVKFSPNKDRTDNPVAQFSGTSDAATAYGAGRFTISGDGLVKLNGCVNFNSGVFSTSEGPPRFVSMNAEGDKFVTSAATKSYFDGLDLATEWVNNGDASFGGLNSNNIRQGGKLRNLGKVYWAGGDILLAYENKANGVVVIENATGATFTIGDHANKIDKANGMQQGTAILLNEGVLEKNVRAAKAKHNLSGVHYQDKAGAKCKQNGSEFDWGNGNPPKEVKGDYALGDGGKVNFGTSLTIGATGSLTGSGTVIAAQVFNFGIVAPGENVADASQPTQNLTIVGDFTNGSTGILSLNWWSGQGITTVDTLTVQADEATQLGGNMTLAGTIQLVGTPVYLDTASTFTLFSFTGFRTGWFDVEVDIPTGWASSTTRKPGCCGCRRPSCRPLDHERWWRSVPQLSEGVPMFAISFALSLGVFHSPALAEYRAVVKLAQERRATVVGLDQKADNLYQLDSRLSAHLDSNDPKVRLEAVRGFAIRHSRIRTSFGIGPQVNRIIRHDSDPTIRKEALALQTDIFSEDAILTVVGALSDADNGVRDAAAFWFVNHPIRSDLALPALKAYLSDALRKPASRATEESIRQGLFALWSYGRSADLTVPIVLLATDYVHLNIRHRAILVLSHIARDREGMAAEFGKRFVHANRKLYDPDRVAALNAAPNLGPAAVVFLQDYLRFVQDDVLGNRPAGVASQAHIATGAFRKLGPAAKNAIPELVKLAARADEKSPLRVELAICALRIGATEDADLTVLAKVLAAKDGQEGVIRELSFGDRFPQFRRQADKLCKRIAAEWDTDPPLSEEIFRQSKSFANALGADGAGLLPFLDKIAGVAGPPDQNDPNTRDKWYEYIRREGQAAAASTHIRAEIARAKAAPKR